MIAPVSRTFSDPHASSPPDYNSNSTSPSLILDFAPQPTDADASTANPPRGWSLQAKVPKSRTLGPISALPPDGPAGTSLTSTVGQEKPWYKISDVKNRGWGKKADADLLFEALPERGKVGGDGGKNGFVPGAMMKKSEKLCVAKFDQDRAVCGLYASASSGDGKVMHTIGHEYAPKSRYRCKVFPAGNTTGGDENDLFWQTLGPSATVLELVNEQWADGGAASGAGGTGGAGGKRVALFVYTSDPAQQMDPVTGRRKPLRKDEVGELWFVDPGVGWAKEVERTLLTVTTVVEMRKTRRPRSG